MKKNNAFLLFTLISINYSFCQDTNESRQNNNIKIDSFEYLQIDNIITANSIECPYNIKNAINDIKRDSISLVISIAFTGFKNIDKPQCVKFEKKYNVNIEYLGCIRWWDSKTEDMDGYNKKILNHLTKIYGDNVNKEFKLLRKNE